MGSAGYPTIRTPWIETPLIESSTLSRAAGCRIFLKLENLQPASSFKSRGIGNLVLQNVLRHETEGALERAGPCSLHFYCSSGGNAGLACVTAARSLGYPATVVVPATTAAEMIAKIKVAGAAEVIQHGDSWVDADRHMREDVIAPAERKGQKCVYVPPFDHPDIWDGAATMVEEMRTQMPSGERPDVIVCSVGGGGLFSGIVNGLDRVGWGDDSNAVKILALETDGAASLNFSLKNGKHSQLDKITSIAKSLGAVKVSADAFEKAQRPNVTSVVLDDAEACMGSWRFADDEKILVEPACGVSLAMCYDGRLKRLVKGLTPESKVVIVVCGGSNTSLEKIVEWKKMYGCMVEKLTVQTRDEEVPSSHTMP